MCINPLRKKSSLYYLKTQSVPRSKYTLSLLYKKEYFNICFVSHTKLKNILGRENVESF